jgi:hypothetical protein
VAWLAFHAGGFFVDTTGTVAVALCIALVLRTTLAGRPAAGWGLPMVACAGALAGLGIWVLASALWSHAPARSLIEFDRVLLYAGVVALTGSAAVRVGDLAIALRWIAVALAAVCVAGLLSRLLPDVVPISSTFLRERLSFPLTYWNAMGIASALAMVLAVHHTASAGERGIVRVLAAALLPVFAVTLYFTFSRGAIFLVPFGVLAYVIAAQPRTLLTALPAAGLPTLIAVRAAYGNDLLARADYDTSARAVAQGHDLLLVVVACAVGAGLLRALALPLDRRLVAVRIDARRLRRARHGFLAGVLLVAIVAGLAVDVPGRARQAYDTFTQGNFYSSTPDLRDRLTSTVDNGRIDNWRVALDAFRADPLLGTGAGTYRMSWELRRPPPPVQVIDGHSLYLETLSELGIPGLLLVLVAVGAPLAAAAARLRGPERHAHAALLATGGMLAVHAAVDWDWEMPALFVVLFGAGGVALAVRSGRERFGDLGRVTRIVIALGLLVLAVTPFLVTASQRALERSDAAFERRDCPAAIDSALDALGRLSVRAEPWEVIGYCDARLGSPELARTAMAAARRRDPDNWLYAYGTALVAAYTGVDPLPAAREAVALNPREPLARRLVARLRRAKGPADWRRIGADTRVPTR